MSIIIKDLLEKYGVNYSNFPKGILNIEINHELDHFTNFSEENEDVYVFTGEYPSIRRNDKELMELVKIVIDLRDLPSKNKIKMVKEMLDNENVNPEKYDLPLEQLIKIINEVKGKRVVFYYHNIKGDVCGNYYNYDLFGHRRAQS